MHFLVFFRTSHKVKCPMKRKSIIKMKDIKNYVVEQQPTHRSSSGLRHFVSCPRPDIYGQQRSIVSKGDGGMVTKTSKH